MGLMVQQHYAKQRQRTKNDGHHLGRTSDGFCTLDEISNTATIYTALHQSVRAGQKKELIGS